MNLRRFFTSQSWWGKILGALLGYLTAGPVGALFGILIGNIFDRGLSEHFSRPYWHYHIEKREAVQNIFFEATFSIMGHIAKADGRVSTQEIKMAKELMQDMRLNFKQRELAKSFFNAGKKPNFNVIPLINKLRMMCHDNRELLNLFVDIQYKAAHVDGWTDNKLYKMNVILTALGFAPLHQQHRFYEDFIFTHRTDETRSRYQSHQKNDQRSYSSNQTYSNHTQSALAHAYEILQVSPQSEHQEVKRAYRRLISRNHPDKLISQGLPEEMIKLANEKTQKIRKAYEQICKSKGWK